MQLYRQLHVLFIYLIGFLILFGDLHQVRLHDVDSQGNALSSRTSSEDSVLLKVFPPSFPLFRCLLLTVLHGC
jgi:hypothetical protein